MNKYLDSFIGVVFGAIFCYTNGFWIAIWLGFGITFLWSRLDCYKEKKTRSRGERMAEKLCQEVNKNKQKETKK